MNKVLTILVSLALVGLIIGCGKPKVKCHFCAMDLPDTTYVIKIRGKTLADTTWYECCPMCAVKDIVKRAPKDSSTITTYCDSTKALITIYCYNGKYQAVDPASTFFLIGGACALNKIFVDSLIWDAWQKKRDWALDKPTVSAKRAFEMVKAKSR